MTEARESNVRRDEAGLPELCLLARRPRQNVRSMTLDGRHNHVIPYHGALADKTDHADSPCRRFCRTRAVHRGRFSTTKTLANSASPEKRRWPRPMAAHRYLGILCVAFKHAFSHSTIASNISPPPSLPYRP